MTKCKYCGAWIDWINTPAGRYMPVEARPVIIRTDRGGEKFITAEGRIVHGERALPQREVGGLVAAYVPHWAACGKGRPRRREAVGPLFREMAVLG